MTTQTTARELAKLLEQMGDLHAQMTLINLADQVDTLTKERDSALEQNTKLDASCAKLEAERDALLTKINLANRKFAVLNNNNALDDLYQVGFEQMREIARLTAERDALMAAGKLASYAMARGYIGKRYASYRAAQAALKEAGVAA